MFPQATLFLMVDSYTYKKIIVGTSLVDKNLPANAGDTGLISGPGRFHMLQLSLCSPTAEPAP